MSCVRLVDRGSSFSLKASSSWILSAFLLISGDKAVTESSKSLTWCFNSFSFAVSLSIFSSKSANSLSVDWLCSDCVFLISTDIFFKPDKSSFRLSTSFLSTLFSVKTLSRLFWYWMLMFWILFSISVLNSLIIVVLLARDASASSLAFDSLCCLSSSNWFTLVFRIFIVCWLS